MIEKPVPEVSELGRPYWDAAQRGELHLQKCAECGSFNSYATRWCTTCLSPDTVWTKVSGRGTVESFSIVYMPPAPAFAADVPYVIAIIRLTEQAQVMTNIVNCRVDDVRIGMAVRVTFEERTNGFMVPQFEPNLVTHVENPIP
jgi:uncharacterized OB-fold protein